MHDVAATIQRRRLSLVLVALTLLSYLMLISQPGVARAESVRGGPITRAEVMERADDWLRQANTLRYNQGGWKAHVDDPSFKYRTDCSGFVAMALHMDWSPSTAYYRDNADFQQINKADLLPGDVLSFPDRNGTDGHAILFAGYEPDGMYFQYYTFGDTPIQKLTGKWSDARIGGHAPSRYTAYRYREIVETTPQPPIVLPARTAMVNNAQETVVMEGGLQGNWAQMGNGNVQVEVTSTRMAVLNSAGQVWVKEGGVSGQFIHQIDHATHVAIDGDRIAVVVNGVVYVKEGDLLQNWVEQGLGERVELAGDRIGVLHQGTLSVKDGGLSATFYTQSNQVSDFALTPNRIGVARLGGLEVKEGNLFQGWTPMGLGQRIVLSGDRIGAINNGVASVKEGGLYADWVVLGPNNTDLVLAGDRVGTISGGIASVKEGNLASGWYTMGQANDLALSDEVIIQP